MSLNEVASQLAVTLEARAEALRIVPHRIGGANVLDCGVVALGGLQAGLGLARICMAGRAEVALVPSTMPGLAGPALQVFSDDPLHACMTSQYAGWQIAVGKYFAMGSGPMRAAYGREALFEHLPGREQAALAVGVLETRKLPTEEVVAYLSGQLGLPAERLTLLCARTSSLAGTVQVVARSLETALHKMHELKFDLREIVSGHGLAPLPPVAGDDLTAIGWTNDAILYGGQVTLWLQGDDAQIAELGPKIPSSASSAHGSPFAEVFKAAGNDFYKIDPNLFSPAQVTLVNLKTGRTHRFGQVEPSILQRSFGGG
ncbi:MAG: methenyltetrahydromethanopterin cyclohydrolase [Gemmataceae bacterium]